MSGNNTVRMINAYNQMAMPTLFLSGMFQSPPINFHTSEDVEIDIVRSDEDIAIAVQDLSVGNRANSTDLFTNKRFTPPIFAEEIPINSFDLIKREPGQNPFESPDFRANVIRRMFNGMTKVENKIRRSMELQASQVLQTGIVTLKDENGVDLYVLDYKPKATHFPTAGTAWNAGGADIQGDISSVAEVIRNDGLSDPDELIMGIAAYNAFSNDPAIQLLLNNRRMEIGAIGPMQNRGNGGTFRGNIEIDNYRYDIWTYGGRYKDPQTGVKTQFIDPASCIVRASDGRLDATFGAIPNIGALLGINNASRLIPELPPRVSNASGGMDMSINAWLTADGAQLFGSAGARPLMIPTAIDTYGNIATGT